MSLRQINVSFDPRQDRLLMRISTTEATEFQIWLTRRIVRGMIPGMYKILATTLAAQSPSPQAQVALLNFQHESAVQQASFSQSYTGDDLSPAMAGTPLLVDRLQLRQLEPGQYLMIMAPQQGDAIQIKLGEVLMHGVLKLIQDALLVSQWDLTLPLAASGQNEISAQTLN